MNILLVMPKTGYLWDEWASPPIGITYVSAYLKKMGKNVYTLNLNLEDDDIYDVLERYINTYDIDILGTGELVVNYSKIQEIAKVARKIKPVLKIWIGGGLVTNSPYEAMQLIPEADFGMIGEGELTSYELVSLIEKSKSEITEEDLLKIDGLIFKRKDGTLCCSAKRQDIENLDEIPFPDWEGFKLTETCLKYAKTDNGVVASVVSSRSCPNSCTFCSKTGGKKYRKRSLDNIFAEIDELVNRYQVTRINFNDELFADSSNRLYEFCDRIEKYGITYRISMHIGKNLTLPLLKRMRESGCRSIFYGLESADNEVLKSMRKHTTIEDIESCLELTKKAGIAVEGNFIFGDPVETVDSMHRTLEWIENNLYMGVFEVAAIKLYPGSQLYQDAITNGTIKDRVKFIEEGCPLINVSRLSDEEYQQMINIELTKIQEFRLRKQENVQVLVKGNRIYGETICSCCGEKITFEVKELSQILRLFTKNCHKCNAIEYINLFPIYFDLVKSKIQHLMENKNVAVFGCGNVWKMFYVSGKHFQENNYIIIDETPFLQKNGWNGKNVYSPEIIKNQKVDTVLVMLRTSKKEIEEKLKDKYGIENVQVIMCYELLNS